MQRYLTPFLMGAIALGLTTNLQAGAISDLLTLDGTPETLEDNDFDFFLDEDNSGSFSEDDIFVGMAEIPDGVAGDNTFTSVFAFAVVETANPGVFNVRPLSASEYTTLHDGDWGNLPSEFAGDTDTLYVVYDDSTRDGVLGTDSSTGGLENFINQGPDGAATSASGANDALSTAIGTKLFELEENDTFEVFLGGGGGFTFDGGFSVVNPTNGAENLNFLPVTEGVQFNLDGDPVRFKTGDIVISGSNDGTLDNGYFTFSTDSNFTLNAVPEPTSLALFGLSALGMAGFGLRRRKHKGEDLAA